MAARCFRARLVSEVMGLLFPDDEQSFYLGGDISCNVMELSPMTSVDSAGTSFADGGLVRVLVRAP